MEVARKSILISSVIGLIQMIRRLTRPIRRAVKSARGKSRVTESLSRIRGIDGKLQLVRRMLNKSFSPKSRALVLSALHKEVSFTDFMWGIRAHPKELLNSNLVTKSIQFGYGRNLVDRLRLRDYTDREQPIVSPISQFLGKSPLETARILVAQGVDRRIMKQLLIRENFPAAAKQF